MSEIETSVTKPKLSFFESDQEYIILDNESEVKLDKCIQDVYDYMKNNDGKGKSEEEKDELYKNAQQLWSEFRSELQNTKYNFYLNRKQWKFLTDLLLSKLEYDQNTVFFAIELTNMLTEMKNMSFKNDEEYVPVDVNATEITYIYHLISKFTVKGLRNSAYRFSEVLIRIGDISKIFNYYDTNIKGLSGEIQDWVAAFDPNVIKNEETPDEDSIEDTVEATVVDSKK